MGRLESFFLALLATWAVWSFTGDGLPSFVPVKAPIAADGLHVLIVRDVSTQDPKTAAVVNSVTLRAAVEDKGGAMRVIDPSVPPSFAPYAAAIPADTATPTLIVSNSARGGEASPITTVEDAVALVNKWGS